MRDLFSSDQTFEAVQLSKADVSLLRDLITRTPHHIIFEQLLFKTAWKQKEMNFYGRRVLQPRLTAWYGDPGRTYKYSGIQNDPLPWTDLLQEVKDDIEKVTRCSFNSVLLNYYRDNNDSMGFHSDDEKELGPVPTIASFSLGDERTFLFKSKIHPEASITSVPLLGGSLLLMKGLTQKNYKHAINKESRLCGPRINLTFRTVFTPIELRKLEEYQC